MFIYKTKKIMFSFFCIIIMAQAYSDAGKLDFFNNYSINKYSGILDKLLFFKNDKFKVFYGGPVSNKNEQGAKWIMPVLFQDEHYKTRALYELVFVNCDLKSTKDAEVLFLNVSDINIKFRNLLSEDYNAFNNAVIAKNARKKYIVVRKADFGMVHYPDIFISSLFSIDHENDKKIIIKFLNEKFQSKITNKTIFESNRQDVVVEEDNQKIIYEPIFIKTKINNGFYFFYITKLILKNDNWKLYYIVTKEKNYKAIPKDKVLVRMDSGCVSGQIYDDEACDCADQLYESLKSVANFPGFGVVIHIPAHDGRGFGTALKAETEIYKIGGVGRVHNTLKHLNTIEAAELLYGKNQYDLRTFDGAAKVLKLMNIKHVLLITDNILKIQSLKSNGIRVSRIKTNSNKITCLNHLSAKRKSKLYYSE